MSVKLINEMCIPMRKKFQVEFNFLCGEETLRDIIKELRSLNLPTFRELANIIENK